MRRKLFNGLAAISLVLCVATIALWVESFWLEHTISWVRGRGVPQEYFELSSYRHRICMARKVSEIHGAPAGLYFRNSAEDRFFDPSRMLQYEVTPLVTLSGLKFSRFYIAFPHWFLPPLFAFLPAWWICKRWTRARDPECGSAAEAGKEEKRLVHE